jgi:serine/threonine protein kinase
MEPAVIKTPNTPGLDTLEAKGLIKEARILAALGEHPNIIRLIDAVITNNKVYVFMEKGTGDLKEFIKSRVKARKRLTPIQINIIALGILAGISHMHKRRIYHFDVKPGNTLMFEHYRPKIMDFGLARTKLLYPGKEIYDIYVANEGTHGYIPPEGYVYPTPLSKGVDLEKYDSFAVGITILRWLIGSRYGWPDKEKPGRYVEKDAVEISKYWSKKYEDNRKILDRDGLVMVGTVGWMMIQKDPMHRVTVLDAFESLKGALKERRSGRVALDTFKKWGK